MATLNLDDPRIKSLVADGWALFSPGGVSLNSHILPDRVLLAELDRRKILTTAALSEYGDLEDIKSTLDAAHNWYNAADNVIAGDDVSQQAEDDAADVLFQTIEKARGNSALL